MFIIVVFGTIVACCLIAWVGNWVNGKSGEGYGLLAVFVFVIGSLILFISGTISGPEYTEKELFRIELVGLGDAQTTKIEGGLLYIHSSPEGRYVYYYKDGSGGIRQGSIPAEDAVIYEKADVTPEITRECKEAKGSLGDFTFKPYAPDRCEDYQIIVPPGSVLREFNLDAN